MHLLQIWAHFLTVNDNVLFLCLSPCSVFANVMAPFWVWSWPMMFMVIIYRFDSVYTVLFLWNWTRVILSSKWALLKLVWWISNMLSCPILIFLSFSIDLAFLKRYLTPSYLNWLRNGWWSKLRVSALWSKIEIFILSSTLTSCHF